MKKNDIYTDIDDKFVYAVDTIIQTNKDYGIKPSNDNSIAEMIYPSNRGIISSVRSKSKHIPHLALINLSKLFDIDMNYFYNDIPIEYTPSIIKTNNANDNDIANFGDNNVINHVSKKGVVYNGTSAGTDSKNTAIGSIQVNSMINNFISTIEHEQIQQFLDIISFIQTESKSSTQRMEELLDSKTRDLDNFQKSYIEATTATNNEVSEIRKQLHDSQQRELDLLRRYLAKMDII